MAVSISISITQNSQNIAKNTSNVTVTLKCSWTGGSHNGVVNAEGTPQAKGWLKVDGKTYDFAKTFNWPGQTSSGSQTLLTVTTDIPHNDNGTKTLSCSASYNTYVSSGVVEATESKTLTTIKRKSELSVVNGTLGVSQTVNVRRQSTSYKHSIKAVCGNSTLYIKADGSTSTAEVKHDDCSIPFTPPIDWARQNTKGTSVDVTFTITTYSGSDNVGSNSYPKTYIIPDSVKPSCTLEISDATDYKETYGGYLQGLSKLKVVVKATKAYDSNIKTYSTTVDGVAYPASSFTTDALNKSGEITITAKVTDERKRSGTKSEKVTVLAYVKPRVSSLSVHRSNEDGTPNEVDGEYIRVNFSAAVTPLDGKNSTSLVIEYKKTADSKYTPLDVIEELKKPEYSFEGDGYNFENISIVIPADSGSSYNVRVVATDNFDSGSKATTASTGFTIMHWLASGLGMAIGKVSELEGIFDIGMRTRLLGGLLYPVIEPETDLNDVKTPGLYVGENASTHSYGHCPITRGTFLLEVMSGGPDGQLLQRLTLCDKTAPAVYERWYYTNDWYKNSDGEYAWHGGWLYPSIGSEFAVYSSDGSSPPMCRKDGRLVEVRGIVKPAVDIAGGTDMHTICTLPAGYRPSSPIYTICQGSGNCVWLLRVNTSGTVDMSRYRNGDASTTASVGAWLPFQVTFLV